VIYFDQIVVYQLEDILTKIIKQIHIYYKLSCYIQIFYSVKGKGMKYSQEDGTGQENHFRRHGTQKLSFADGFFTGFAWMSGLGAILVVTLLLVFLILHGIKSISLALFFGETTWYRYH
jgi:uncharacterized integral membrane protein